MQKSETQTRQSFTNEELVDIIITTLAKGASTRMKALGSSMTPFIRSGDILTISPISVAQAGLGKIAAFNCSKRKRLIVHRIIKKQDSNYIIKGDNCERPDGSVSFKNILGIITKVERGDRRIYFGLGPERHIIIFLSRIRFIPFVFRFWRILL